MRLFFNLVVDKNNLFLVTEISKEKFLFWKSDKHVLWFYFCLCFGVLFRLITNYLQDILFWWCAGVRVISPSVLWLKFLVLKAKAKTWHYWNIDSKNGQKSCSKVNSLEVDRNTYLTFLLLKCLVILPKYWGHKEIVSYN